MSDPLKKFFPFDEYRTHQKDTIIEIAKAFQSGKSNVILEAPTGTGKSVVGVTLANIFNTAYFITAQKILQQQYLSDFPDLVDLKGRNAYPCWFLMEHLGSNKYYGCDKGQCTRRNKSFLSLCLNGNRCAYASQLNLATKSDQVLFNFSSFLFQREMAGRFLDERKLLVCDECFHPHTHVETEKGRIPIGKLVNQKTAKYTISYNEDTEKLEKKKIIRYLKNKKKMTYKVLIGNRVCHPTLSHKFYNNGKFVPLSKLKVGDLVLTNNIGFSEEQKQVVYGSMLGDMSMQRVISQKTSSSPYHIDKGRRARIRVSHSIKQKEFVEWKNEMLGSHVKNIEIIENKGYGKLLSRFNSKCDFGEFADVCLVEDNGKFSKTINQKWLSKIGALGLAVWYMDDGSCHRNTIKIHTSGFSEKEHKTIKKWLKKSFGINSDIRSYVRSATGSRYLYLNMDVNNSKKFAIIISKHVIPEMRYKLPQCDLDYYAKTTIAEPEVSYQPILSIEPYKETITYNLEVEGHHNYIAGASIVSNCHGIEQQIMNFVEVTIFEKDIGEKLPKFESTEPYMSFFKSIGLATKLIEKINGLKSDLEDLIGHPISESEDKTVKFAAGGTTVIDLSEVYFGDDSNKGAGEDQESANDILKEMNNYKSVLRKYNYLIEYVENVKCICEYNSKTKSVCIKPLYATYHTPRLLMSGGKHRLLMSATILNPKVFGESIGLNMSKTHYISVPHTFPVQNRLIHLDYAGPMDFKSRAKTMPKMVKKVDKIMTKHANEKGIIHCQSFKLMEDISGGISAKNRGRLLDQKMFKNKDELLQAHSVSNNTVIIAPAMHEGLDLKNDLSRFSLILKVPYPDSRDNKQLRIRTDESWNYYLWLTALKLVQSCGRSVRSETDYASTYILDESFDKFFNMTDRVGLLPDWFVESLVVD